MTAMKKLLVFLAITMAYSCTDTDRTRSTLLDNGYTHIEVGGYSTMCSKDDSTCTRFHAIGPTGRPVSGAVGCGRSIGCSKGCTIRYD